MVLVGVDGGDLYPAVGRTLDPFVVLVPLPKVRAIDLLTLVVEHPDPRALEPLLPAPFRGDDSFFTLGHVDDFSPLDHRRGPVLAGLPGLEPSCLSQLCPAQRLLGWCLLSGHLLSRCLRNSLLGRSCSLSGQEGFAVGL